VRVGIKTGAEMSQVVFGMAETMRIASRKPRLEADLKGRADLGAFHRRRSP
jgi:hypothetical protein